MRILSLILLISFYSCTAQKLDSEYNSKLKKSELIVSVEKSNQLMKMTIDKLKSFKNKHIPKGIEIDRSFLRETDEIIVWRVTMLNDENDIRYFYSFIKYKLINKIILGAEIKEKRITLN